MSVGTPGRDFEVHEVVTADALTRWLRDARWQDLSFSETDGEIIGIQVAESLPTTTSEGLLCYQPRIQKLSVYSRRGWVGVFEPSRWETVRFNPAENAPIGGRVVRMSANGLGGAPSVTANTAAYVYGALNANRDIFVLEGTTVGPGATAATNTVYPLLGWGLGAAIASPAVDKLFYPVKPDVVGNLATPITDYSAPSNQLNLDAIGVIMQFTLAPDGTTASGVYPLFYYGGPLLHVFREDGL